MTGDAKIDTIKAPRRKRLSSDERISKSLENAIINGKSV